MKIGRGESKCLIKEVQIVNIPPYFCLIHVHFCKMSRLSLQVSVIAKHEFSRGQWAELNQFILQHCNSSDPGQREVGVAVVYGMLITESRKGYQNYVVCRMCKL